MTDRAQKPARRRQDQWGRANPAARAVVASHDPGVLTLAESVVSGLGYRVTTTTVGLGVVEHLGPGPLRAVGPDRIGLLVLDGSAQPWVALSLVEGLRSAQRQLPVVVIMNRDCELDARAERLGAVAILRLPVASEALERCVRTLVNR